MESPTSPRPPARAPPERPDVNNPELLAFLQKLQLTWRRVLSPTPSPYTPSHRHSQPTTPLTPDISAIEASLSRLIAIIELPPQLNFPPWDSRNAAFHSEWCKFLRRRGYLARAMESQVGLQVAEIVRTEGGRVGVKDIEGAPVRIEPWGPVERFWAMEEVDGVLSAGGGGGAASAGMEPFPPFREGVLIDFEEEEEEGEEMEGRVKVQGDEVVEGEESGVRVQDGFEDSVETQEQKAEVEPEW